MNIQNNCGFRGINISRQENSLAHCLAMQAKIKVSHSLVVFSFIFAVKRELY